MKAEGMAALDVDSSQGDFLQQEEERGSQVRCPLSGSCLSLYVVAVFPV